MLSPHPLAGNNPFHRFQSILSSDPKVSNFLSRFNHEPQACASECVCDRETVETGLVPNAHACGSRLNDLSNPLSFQELLENWLTELRNFSGWWAQLKVLRGEDDCPLSTRD